MFQRTSRHQRIARLSPRAKRTFDVVAAVTGLVVAAPVLVPTAVAVWRHDRSSPLYVSTRIGKSGVPFKMVKLRSMSVGADQVGVDSTSASDPRITAVGHFIRRYKLDELTQLWNVLRGEMSLVGPRPNVQRGVDRYTDQERVLLSVKPGVTDFASIGFADEAEILDGAPDPDQAYDELIRPWKSRLGLFYVDHQSIGTDASLVLLTALTVVSRDAALSGVCQLLGRLGADTELVQVSRRKSSLVPSLPPGESTFTEVA